jgi:hypothetical protein
MNSSFLRCFLPGSATESFFCAPRDKKLSTHPIGSPLAHRAAQDGAVRGCRREVLGEDPGGSAGKAGATCELGSKRSWTMAAASITDSPFEGHPGSWSRVRARICRQDKRRRDRIRRNTGKSKNTIKRQFKLPQTRRGVDSICVRSRSAMAVSWAPPGAGVDGAHGAAPLRQPRQ